MLHLPQSQPRRLRTAVLLLITAFVATMVAACGGSSSSDPKALNVLTWETYHDPAWLDAFTKETGIKVNAVNVGSADEMFAKIKANPNQFDL
ncbi:extracellular solute-binding protein, partial [Mycolicibacterium komossense]